MDVGDPLIVASDPGRFRPWLTSPIWALVLIGAPLLMGLLYGPLFIDDASITFRYAENLARGRGFVYNSTPILGTTAPLYCLLLALLRRLGAPIAGAAFAIGVAAAAAAPPLVWRTGARLGRPAAGLIGALALALFPTWWVNAKTGMETTLAAALVAAVAYLAVSGRMAAAGLAAGALVLTRPDAALLPGLIFLAALVQDRRRAMRFAAAAAAVTLPWLVFSLLYFGALAPHSLAAKSLIHAYPFHLGLAKYLTWFFPVVGGQADDAPGSGLVSFLAALAMSGLAPLYLIGLARSAAAWRKRPLALAASVWPAVFILGLALTRVGAFAWYKVPAWPLYFLTVGLGVEAIMDRAASGPGRRPGPRALAVIAVLLPLAFIGLKLAEATPFILNPKLLAARVDKERTLLAQGNLIAARVRELGLKPAEVKVFAGEVGVLGFVLGDCVMIDSSGINSEEALAARWRDWRRLRAAHPEAGWPEQWSGTPEWVLELIRAERPTFIASNRRYLHLEAIARRPDFEQTYQLIDAATDAAGETFVVYERQVE